MQSALNTEVEETLVTAQTLREMTATKEDLLARQKESVLNALMSSMTQLASQQGETKYEAKLAPQFDATVLASIVDRLKGLGYTVSSEAKNDEKLGSFILLSISWA